MRTLSRRRVISTLATGGAGWHSQRSYVRTELMPKAPIKYKSLGLGRWREHSALNTEIPLPFDPAKLKLLSEQPMAIVL
jgi:hypothetical protein